MFFRKKVQAAGLSQPYQEAVASLLRTQILVCVQNHFAQAPTCSSMTSLLYSCCLLDYYTKSRTNEE